MAGREVGGESGNASGRPVRRVKGNGRKGKRLGGKLMQDETSHLQDTSKISCN